MSPKKAASIARWLKIDAVEIAKTPTHKINPTSPILPNTSIILGVWSYVSMILLTFLPTADAKDKGGAAQ
ncbi:MAG: hypothetical protein GDA43_25910 [Hormoscilla sp. SP5CHS1]|nr:hypothetical protein [Hormoscilla sp. SP12CHS1]MBC6456166.1 hypothetical protein [Hormoscilla sp. SP5CHS1]